MKGDQGPNFFRPPDPGFHFSFCSFKAESFRTDGTNDTISLMAGTDLWSIAEKACRKKHTLTQAPLQSRVLHASVSIGKLVVTGPREFRFASFLGHLISLLCSHRSLRFLSLPHLDCFSPFNPSCHNDDQSRGQVSLESQAHLALGFYFTGPFSGVGSLAA